MPCGGGCVLPPKWIQNVITSKPTTTDQINAIAYANLGRISERSLWIFADDAEDPVERGVLYAEIECRNKAMSPS